LKGNPRNRVLNDVITALANGGLFVHEVRIERHRVLLEISTHQTVGRWRLALSSKTGVFDQETTEV
jgi:hypothetical protein